MTRESGEKRRPRHSPRRPSMAFASGVWLRELIQDVVIACPDGAYVPVDALAGRTLLLYWNDHAIRRHGEGLAFTGALVDYYAAHHDRLRFEVLWLSANDPLREFDRFEAGRARMPWLCTKLGSALPRRLADIFRVRSPRQAAPGAEEGRDAVFAPERVKKGVPRGRPRACGRPGRPARVRVRCRIPVSSPPLALSLCSPGPLNR